MDFRKLLKESILDDLLSDFKDVGTNVPDTSKVKVIKMKANKQLPRIKFKGKKFNTEIKYVSNFKFRTISDIVKNFAENNIAIAEDKILQLDTKDIYKYREYDRKLENGFTGKQSEHEYNELKNNIKRKGFNKKGYLILNIEREKNGNVNVHLGEGNHRLKIGQELKIKKLPIKIYYRKE